MIFWGAHLTHFTIKHNILFFFSLISLLPFAVGYHLLFPFTLSLFLPQYRSATLGCTSTRGWCGILRLGWNLSTKIRSSTVDLTKKTDYKQNNTTANLVIRYRAVVFSQTFKFNTDPSIPIQSPSYNPWHSLVCLTPHPPSIFTYSHSIWRN